MARFIPSLAFAAFIRNTYGNECKVFITSTTHNGALGGIDSADAICQNISNTAGLAGTFKAWLTRGSYSPAADFTQAHYLYVRVGGGGIASDRAKKNVEAGILPLVDWIGCAPRSATPASSCPEGSSWPSPVR
mmetsp:Transcript_1360/g.3759  ORF Transcript_1360/g.3759 Transcript_1360/m.3759 type:complete len:133 (-) Transcript_1360:369-767(-)